MLSLLYWRKSVSKKQRIKLVYIQYLLHLKKLLSYFQYHRGLSYSYLNGQQSAAQEIIEKQRLIAQELPSLALLARHPHLAEHWQALLDHWRRLQVNNLELAMEENLAQHNRLINTLLYLIEDLTELKAWSSQDHRKGLGSIVAILHTTEWLGQARALGSGMIAANRFGQSEQGQMGFIQGKLQDCLQLHSSNHDSLDKLLALSQNIGRYFIDQQQTSELSGNQYFNMASEVIDSYMAELDSIMGRLQQG